MSNDTEGTQPPPEGPQTREQKELDDFQKRVNDKNREGVPGQDPKPAT